MQFLLTIFYVMAILGFISFVKNLMSFNEEISKFDRILLSAICAISGVECFSSLVKLWS